MPSFSLSLTAGASGFLLKRTPAADLVAGIRIVAAGDGMIAPSVTTRLIAGFREKDGRPGMLRDLKHMLEARGFAEGNTSTPGAFVIERAFAEQ